MTLSNPLSDMSVSSFGHKLKDKQVSKTWWAATALKPQQSLFMYLFKYLHFTHKHTEHFDKSEQEATTTTKTISRSCVNDSLVNPTH